VVAVVVAAVVVVVVLLLLVRQGHVPCLRRLVWKGSRTVVHEG
jgi:hypothetical protein